MNGNMSIPSFPIQFSSDFWTLIDSFSRKLIFFEILWDLEPRWHFINFTVISLIVINENMKISRKPVLRHSRTVLGIILLKKNQNFIDYFRRKVIFFEIFNLHFSTFWLFTYFQFQFILFWTNQFQIWKHQWIP